MAPGFVASHNRWEKVVSVCAVTQYMLVANNNSQNHLVLCEMLWDQLCTNIAELQMFMTSSVNSPLPYRQTVCKLPGCYSAFLSDQEVPCNNWFLSVDYMDLKWSWHDRCTHSSMTKNTTPSENCSTWHKLSAIHTLHSNVNVCSTNKFRRQK